MTLIEIPDAYVRRAGVGVIMTERGTNRIACIASCAVDDDHNVSIDHRAHARMLRGDLPWLYCCGEPMIVISRGVPIDEVKA